MDLSLPQLCQRALRLCLSSNLAPVHGLSQGESWHKMQTEQRVTTFSKYVPYGPFVDLFSWASDRTAYL